MKGMFFILISLMSLSSCVYNHSNGLISLGGNYYYVQDGHESTIFYNLKKDNKVKFGETIIEPSSIYYFFNEDYIFVKNKTNNEKSYSYWLINKKKKEKPLLMSIDEFKDFTETRNIKIEFKK